MDRRGFLRMAGAAALALPAARLWADASDFDFEHAKLKAHPLDRSRLLVVTGGGGNVTLLVGPDGLLQFDSGISARSADYVSADHQLSRKPIQYLVNTHWHADHVGGNEALAKKGARIIAQDKTYDRMATAQRVDFMKMDIPAYPEAARPVLTFSDHFTLRFAGETITLEHVAPAHTDTDIFAHLEKENTLVVGDLFFNGFYPFIDYSSGGWIGGMIAAADRILPLADAKTRIIPGHGPVGTAEDYRRFRDMLQTVQDQIAPLVTAGKTQDEVVAAHPLKDLDSVWGGGFLKGDQFAAIVYQGLARPSRNK